MVRNLKVLGLALAACFAFSALAATGAMAQTQGHLTSDGPFTLIGEEVAGGSGNAFTGAFGAEVRCPDTVYTGHKTLTLAETATKSHEPLTSGETGVTITPHYAGCLNEDKEEVEVRMNGCDYDFDDFTTTGGVAGTYGLTVDIVCPTGKVIEIEPAICGTITVGPQTDITGFHATNLAGGKGLISGSATVKAKICGFNLSVTQDQNVEIEGLNAQGQTTGVSISD